MHHVDRGAPTKLGMQMFNYPDRDIFQPNHRKSETPWEEIWQAMDLLVQQGKVLYVGTSNFAGWHITQGCERAACVDHLPESDDNRDGKAECRSQDRRAKPLPVARPSDFFATPHAAARDGEHTERRELKNENQDALTAAS